MFERSREYDELSQRIGKLTPEEQLLLAEEILSGVRRAHFTDVEAYRRAVRDELAALLAAEAAERGGQRAGERNRAAG